VEIQPPATFLEYWSAQGATLLGVAADQQLIGLVAVRDVVKTHAPAVVRQLSQQGKSVYLITGDNHLTAAAIAEQVGISAKNVFAEIDPEEKAITVARLQERGER